MACKWNYEIEGWQKFQNVTVKIANTAFDLKPKVPKVRLVKVAETVSYECKDVGGCKPKIFNLSYDDPPKVELGDLSDLFVFTTGVEKIAKKLGVTINQPSLNGDSEVRLVSTNDGACLNVHLFADVKVTAGSLSYDPPDIPLPGGFTYETPVITAEFGSTYTDKLSAEYLLCCCRYDKCLEVYTERKHKKPEPVEMEPSYVIEDECCGIDCVYKNNYVKRKNSAAPVEWTIKAMEGECAYTHVMVIQKSDGRFATKRRKNEDKTEKKRTP